MTNEKKQYIWKRLNDRFIRIMPHVDREVELCFRFQVMTQTNDTNDTQTLMAESEIYFLGHLFVIICPKSNMNKDTT